MHYTKETYVFFFLQTKYYPNIAVFALTEVWYTKFSAPLIGTEFRVIKFNMKIN